MIRLRSAVEQDIPFLRDLHHRAYRDVVLQQFGAWDESAQDSYFEAGLREAEYQIIQLDGAAVGAIATAEDEIALILSELQILPEFQNRGIGSSVLANQLQIAKSLGKVVRLRVLHQNRARLMYARHAFQVVDQTDTHYIMLWRP